MQIINYLNWCHINLLQPEKNSSKSLYRKYSQTFKLQKAIKTITKKLEVEKCSFVIDVANV